MPMSSAPLVEEIAQNCLLIAPGTEALFTQALRHILAHEHASDMLAEIAAGSSEEEFWPEANSWMAQLRPYVVKNGVLQIPVMGVLLNRFPYQMGRWATGYTYIEKALARGLADANVKGIAFIHHSPGGEAAGCFELSDKIHDGRKVKPIRAFVSDMSYSASYALSSAAKQVIITRSGGAGSVGVVMTHVEFSEALKREGIKVTFVFKGKHKVDGNPYEKLPEAVQSRWQERIDRTYGIFTSTVARNRGMEDAAVRKTEALTYDGDEAVKVGFADKLGTLDEELVLFANECDHSGDGDMAIDNITRAEHDAAVTAATASGKTAGIAEGTAAGTTAERTRVKAVLALPEAEKRQKAALHTALNSDMSVESAKLFLAGLDEEKAAAPVKTNKDASHFEQHMNKDKQPNISAGEGDDAGDGNGEQTSEQKANGILAAYAGAGSYIPEQKKTAA